MTAAVQAARLPAMPASPAAIARVGRRLSKVSLLLWDVARTEPIAPALADRVATLSWLAENLCALHGLAVQCTGHAPDGPAVLLANHLGYFDPMVVLALHAAMPIGKRELAGWPLVGRCLGNLGVEFVDRDDVHAGAVTLRHALAALRGGTSVLVFPEGTTTAGDTVLPLRRGMIGIGARACVPLVPVALSYADPAPCWVGDDWFVPHYARMLARSSIAVRIEFGAPIRASGDASVDTRTVRATLLAMLERMRRR